MDLDILLKINDDEHELCCPICLDNLKEVNKLYSFFFYFIIIVLLLKRLKLKTKTKK
jgi:hypothetical protein